MRKKNLIKGTLILALAGIIAKFLGFFFRIPIIYMIGLEGIGLYQLTYPLYTFILGISAGIPISISKMISERIALNKTREAQRIFQVALITMAIFGGASSIALIVFDDFLIKAFNWSSDVYYSILGIALAPFFTCILSAFRGYFQGIQYMTPSGFSQILEQITRVCVGVGLAYILLPKGIPYAAGGASFGAAAGSIAGLMWISWIYSKNRLKYPRNQSTMSFGGIFKDILKIAIPISLGYTIGSIMALIDSMMVPGLLAKAGFTQQAATALYGQLTGKAFVLVGVPLTLSVALSQSTVPAISEEHAVNNRVNLNKKIVTAFKFASIISLPCAGGLYILSKPILMLVFQGKGDGWELMQILAIASIFIIMAQTATGVLNGIGRTVIPVITMLIGCIVKVFISSAFIPVPDINIRAAAYSTLTAYIVVALLDIVIVRKLTRLEINFKEIFLGPLVCTLIMVFAVVPIYSNMYNLTSSNNKATLVSVALGGIIYAVMLILTKTLGLGEMKRILKRG